MEPHLREAETPQHPREQRASVVVALAQADDRATTRSVHDTRSAACPAERRAGGAHRATSARAGTPRLRQVADAHGSPDHRRSIEHAQGPRVGASSPAIRRSSVLLPDPFGPRASVLPRELEIDAVQDRMTLQTGRIGYPYSTPRSRVRTWQYSNSAAMRASGPGRRRKYGASPLSSHRRRPVARASLAQSVVMKVLKWTGTVFSPRLRRAT